MPSFFSRTPTGFLSIAEASGSTYTISGLIEIFDTAVVIVSDGSSGFVTDNGLIIEASGNARKWSSHDYSIMNSIPSINASFALQPNPFANVEKYATLDSDVVS